MKGCGDHLVEMGERGSGTRQAVSAWILEPRTLDPEPRRTGGDRTQWVGPPQPVESPRGRISRPAFSRIF